MTYSRLCSRIIRQFTDRGVAQLVEMIGSTGQYVNRIIKKGDGVINKTFVEMLDALGYDIQLTYVKKEEA